MCTQQGEGCFAMTIITKSIVYFIVTYTVNRIIYIGIYSKFLYDAC